MRTTLLCLLLISCTPDPGEDSQPPTDSRSQDTQDSIPPDADPCAELGLPMRDFEAAEDDDSLYATAADFTVPTRGGDWSFSERWTGCDVVLMIQDSPNQARGWPIGLWERDVGDLFDKLPRNTQLLFFSTGTSTTAIDESLDGLAAEVDDVMADMDEADRAWWQGRVHYVTQRAQIADGWVGRIMNDPGWGVGIDRFQRIRYIGSYADPTRYDSGYGWFAPNLSFAANEAIYYNFEAEREISLEAQGAMVVEVFDGTNWSSSVEAEIAIPAEAADYDSLALDLHMGCGGQGEYGECFAWDTGARLLVCDQPAEDNPWADTPCEPGTTQEGACADPLGGTTTGSYTCDEDGAGYGELACACSNEMELGRWITTYHREGRWVHEVTGLQPLLTPGETERLKFVTGSSYSVDLDLRYFDAGLATESEEIVHLFGSCNLAGDCNATYEDGATVEIPADAAKVTLATVITGHGMSDPGNCAEFCDMDHVFSVAGQDVLTVNFDVEGPDYRCEEEVDQGTVPNQYGTWWYSRHGWCPGRDVPVQLHDLTEQVTLGAENRFDYRVLYRGDDYTDASSWADIWANVWLVIER